MILPAEEFLSRFLLHVLPGGFVRIRHLGLLANRGRTARLARCRAFLAAVAPEAPAAPEPVAPVPAGVPVVCGHKALPLAPGFGYNPHNL